MQFYGTVVLDKSPDFEIVSQKGDTVIIRTFQPQPFKISGRVNGAPFHDMIVPVRSVLKKDDKMDAAPLKPPIRQPAPRLPIIAITLAAVAAIAAWTIAALRRREQASAPVEVKLPADRFRETVTALRKNPRTPFRWARLADALRDYLDATTDLTHDLTTTEVIERSASKTLAGILQQGDLEKFSPWGPMPDDFDALARRALDLVPEREEAKAA